jgi:hypothetical protein
MVRIGPWPLSSQGHMIGMAHRLRVAQSALRAWPVCARPRDARQRSLGSSQSARYHVPIMDSDSTRLSGS